MIITIVITDKDNFEFKRSTYFFLLISGAILAKLF